MPLIFFLFLGSLSWLSANEAEEQRAAEEWEKYYNDPGPPFQNYLPPPSPQIKKEEEKVPSEVTVDLKNPTFVKGVIHTEEGGVITGKGLRIQARTIDYTHKIENGIRIQKIEASGDLMVEFSDQVFVGSHLEYDFTTGCGTLINGKTFSGMWFLGGDRIDLKEDGSFYIFNAFITTSDSQPNDWEVDAQEVKITEKNLLSAKNITLKLFKIPFFWVPALKSSLRLPGDSPIRYRLVWDQGIGPRLTLRYRFLSWRDLNLFLRLDYRIKNGFGGAFESEYLSPSGLTTFVTRSYAAQDKSFPFQTGSITRYRLQGLYHANTADEKSSLHLTYDKMSDYRMVGDFPSSDFEIKTQMTTELKAAHEIESSFIHMNVRPRINGFQSINQELPLLSVGIRPIPIGNSNVISTNYVSAGFLDYVYDNGLTQNFRSLGLPTSTHAVRLETRNTLYRPTPLGPVTVNPYVGIIGIFYNNNPHHKAAGQGILSYGMHMNTTLQAQFSKLKHTIEPYIRFEGLSKPTIALSDQFFFDIDDGYHQLNLMRFGVKNHLFSAHSFTPRFSSDLYTNAFFGHKAFAPVLQKYYLDLKWNLPSVNVTAGIAWNAEFSLFDFTNIRTDWTVNEDLALGIEFRHRSRYDWRKADHQNFILDTARAIPELLSSPLSDGRNTVLSRLEARLSPKWTCHIETRNGWGRRNEPAYYALKIGLTTLITWNWVLKLGYERIPGDNRFSGSFNLVK